MLLHFAVILQTVDKICKHHDKHNHSYSQYTLQHGLGDYKVGLSAWFVVKDILCRWQRGKSHCSKGVHDKVHP